MSETGRRAASASFVVLVSPVSPEGDGDFRCRLGLTVSRRVGGAVARNRIKRQVREWFRWEGRRTIVAADIVVIARRGAATLSARAVKEELRVLLRSALERQ